MKKILSFWSELWEDCPAPDDLTFWNDTFVSPIKGERKAVCREIGRESSHKQSYCVPSKRHWNLIIENLAERQKNIQRYSTADLQGSQKYPGWIYPVNNNPAFILSWPGWIWNKALQFLYFSNPFVTSRVRNVG